MSRFRLAAMATLASVLSAALTLTGCGAIAGAPQDPDGELEKTELTVGVLPLADYAAVYWARDHGFFEAEGLTVELEPLQGGPIGVQKVITREVDFSFSNVISSSIAASRGAPIQTVVVTSSLGPGGLGIFVNPDSPIREMSDLDGRTVSINTTNSIGDVAFRNLADSVGEAAQPNWVEVPFNEVIRGVQANSIDAGYLPEPFASAAREAGLREVVALAEGPNIGLPVSNFIASKPFLAQNPDTTAAFVRAMYAAGIDISENIDEFRAWLPGVAGVAPDVAEHMALPIFEETLDLERLQSLGDTLVGQGLLDEFDAHEFVFLPAEVQS
ncbi:ABC transporter substrate-binding protein [Hoyosella subflava]|uniref:ABC-type nitrate/sulfonate/bicarbonate transport systems periplasmic components-like protein n=1 Tax=Hoyosella subflava (strain DSM 45089 / JCM 17490 / NBRC 109087 / DQS3-9A1) TaxID=443218 RepID=F6EFN5_HOYSD|nr:ABC transporter substrate-binding protein [Hoyosella subflava]AEF40964.1 ABC-type nitrate/sulfonate/bicarbonate transport systems periplasmic components-like protein [Hoyosella subflava DQS3-9A1]